MWRLQILQKQKNRMPVDEHTRYGWTPLQLLCFNSDWKQFQENRHRFYDYRIDTNAQDRQGNTALHLLARGFNDDEEENTLILKALLKLEGLRLNLCNESGLTPREEAEYYGNRSFIKLLDAKR